MFTYNFDKELAGLDGKPIEGTNLGKLFGNVIASSEANAKSIKWITWASALYLTGLLVIDNSDRDELREWLKGKTGLNMLVAGALLKVLDNGLPYKVEKTE